MRTIFQDKPAHFLNAARYVLRLSSGQAKALHPIENQPNWPCGLGGLIGRHDRGCPACAGEIWAWKFIPKVREALELTAIENGPVTERRVLAVLEKLEKFCACEMPELAEHVRDTVNRGSELTDAGDLPAFWVIDQILRQHAQRLGVRLPPHLSSEVDFAAYVATCANTRLRPVRRLIATGLLPF